MTKDSMVIEAALLSFFSYLTFLVVEWLRPGFVSTLMDLNLLLLLTLSLFIAALVLPGKVPQLNIAQKVYFGLWGTVLLIALGVLLQRALQGPAWLVYFFASVVAIVVVAVLVRRHH